jgi:colanic acid biosynthesis glycosyl transferase WcaI
VKPPNRRPRILVLNQYYWPGVEATARLLEELCAALADDYDVTVITGMMHGVSPGETTHRGVRVIRVRSTAYDRRQLGLRALNYLTYLAQSFRRALAVPAPDAVLCMTDPPIIGNVALLVARRFRVPMIVVSQDVFPEVAVELGRIDNPFLILILRRAINFYLRRADRVVAIGNTMRERLIEKGARSERIEVIPNWVDTDSIVPLTRGNEWAVEHGLADKFVVMHSGNVGHAQDLDALVRAATFLRDLDDLRIVIIGAGARHAEVVDLATRLDVDNVLFAPYQPREVLSQSLSTADVHVVGLARGLSGYVVPSRLYGIMSAGRPVIVSAEDQSETAQLVRSVECGVVVPPGRAELLAGAMRDAYDGRLDLKEMGRRARAYVVRAGDTRWAIDRYRGLLTELLGTRP